MATLSDSEKLKISYFHSLGKVLTESTQDVYESKYKSSHNVKLSEIWADSIAFASSTTMADAEALTNSAVTKYTLYTLSEIPGSNGQAYYLNDSGNFIRPWISPVDVPDSITNLPSSGYELKLYKQDNTQIGTTSGAWSVDYYAGIIHFGVGYTPSNMGWGNIKATLYVYTGTFGLSGGTNKLSELEDVIITNPQTNDILVYSGSSWVNGNSIFYTKQEVYNTGETYTKQEVIDLLTGITSSGSSFYTGDSIINIGGIESGDTFTLANMQDMWYKLLHPYQYPNVNLTSTLPSNVEVGYLLNSEYDFIWSSTNISNIIDSSFVLSGNSLFISGLTYSGTTGITLNISHDSGYTEVFIISGTNSKYQNFSDNVEVNWKYKIFYGTNSNSGITDSEIISLSSEYSDTRLKSWIQNGNGEYIYYCYPETFSDNVPNPPFYVGGLPNSSWTKTVRNILLNTGIYVSYIIYRTNYIQNGTGINIEKK